MEIIPRPGRWYIVRVSTSHGARYFSGIGNKYEARRKGEVYETLADEYDLSEECSKGTLPVNVVTDGKESIAAYMYAVHEMSKPDVADVLDIRTETVEQYLANVRSGFR